MRSCDLSSGFMVLSPSQTFLDRALRASLCIGVLLSRIRTKKFENSLSWHPTSGGIEKQVPMIENWADVTGTVTKVEPSPLPGHLTLAVDTQSVEPVGSYPNMVGQAGHTVTVNINASVTGASGIRAGDKVSL